MDFLLQLPLWVLVLLMAGAIGTTIYGMRRGYTIQFWPPKLEAPNLRQGGLRGSPSTEDIPLLTNIVNDALETVCRAVCIPLSPRETSVRVFIFQPFGEELVCTHFWSERPSEEQVGVTRFNIDPLVAETVVVVRAYIEKSIQRSPVHPNPSGLKGKIDQEIRYVLACPIYSNPPDGERRLIGVVDFDAITDEGIRLLKSEIANEVMYCLAREIGIVLSFKSMSDSN